MIEKLLAQHSIEKARRPARMRKKFASQSIIEESPSGESALLASVLALAIVDAHTDEYAAEARRWLLSDSREPLAFRWYCDLLNLDPSHILRIAFPEVEDPHGR